MTARALVAVDLDQTVVYSERSAGQAGPSVVVEHLDGAPLSSMTVGAVAAYRALAARHCVVPVTTRTVAQYARIVLPAPAAHAVCANGGVLLVDGVRDPDWDAWTTALLAGAAPVGEVEARLRRHEGEDWVRLVRVAEGLFVYLVAHRRDQLHDAWLDELADDLGPLGWTLSVQGRKAYAVPAGLTKAAAVDRLADLLADRLADPLADPAADPLADPVGRPALLAAGDSLLDRPLLELALRRGGAAVRPAHGELHEQGWTGCAVTAQSGARAGEELLHWLAERADALTGREAARRAPSSA